MAHKYRYTPCTKEDLLKIIQETPAENPLRPKVPPPGAQPSPWAFVRTTANNYDEVYPGIILGDQSIAKDKGMLRSLHVTHIVNAAQGKKFAQVDTNEEFYEDLSVKFYGISAMDTANFKISVYFNEVADFIHEAIVQGGRVLVHCHMGLSRSATLVLAYLMLKWDKPVQAALRAMRQKRQVFPNNGFLKQLCILNEELFKDKFVQPDEDEVKNNDDSGRTVSQSVSACAAETSEVQVS